MKDVGIVMSINILAQKYNMDTLEDFKNFSEEPEDFATMMWYQTFLKLTDHIPIKLMEGSLSTEDCREELAARELARSEIARINGESYEPKQNTKTLDERTAILEDAGLETVLDHECRLSMLEIGITE